MRSRNPIILFLCAFSCTDLVLAQPDASQVSRELKEISERSVLLEAKIKEAELAAKLEKTLAERAQKEASAKNVSASLQAAEVGTPVVSHVEGVQGKLEAVLVYPNGSRQRVKTGDAIYGAVVQKVALNEVLLFDTKTKSQVRLQFSQAAGMSQMPQQPGMPIGSGYAPPVVIPTPPTPLPR